MTDILDAATQRHISYCLKCFRLTAVETHAAASLPMGKKMA